MIFDDDVFQSYTKSGTKSINVWLRGDKVIDLWRWLKLMEWRGIKCE